MWEPTHSNSLLEDLMTYSSNGSHPEFDSLLQDLHVLLGIDLSGPDGLAEVLHGFQEVAVQGVTSPPLGFSKGAEVLL